MKYKVHGVGRKSVQVNVLHEGAKLVANVEAIEIELVPLASYAKSYTHVVLPKTVEEAAAIEARFAVDAEFEIEPV